jgi:hypothetical protein
MIRRLLEHVTFSMLQAYPTLHGTPVKEMTNLWSFNGLTRNLPIWRIYAYVLTSEPN